MYTYTKPKDNKAVEFTGYMVDESSLVKNVDFSSIPRSKEYTECMESYFDTTDDMTRKVLLAVNEAEQPLIMQALANKLYGHIITRVDDINFGSIPLSKGDITKMDHYEQLVDCLNVLSEVMQNYNQPVDLVDTVQIALQNVIDRRELFMKGYRVNAEMPIITYNTLALSIVSSVSLLITSTIEFTKLPDNKGFDIAFDKSSKIKGKDKILYKNLEQFNKMCDNGQFDKVMDFVIKNNLAAKKENAEMISESLGGTIGAKLAWGAAKALFATNPVIAVAASIPFIISALILLLNIIRNAIYYWYYARTSVSEYFDNQSALLVMNAYNVENNLTKDERERKAIAEKQNRVAKFFSALADKIRVKDRVAEQKASGDIDKHNKEKYKYNDVVDSIPDSANAVLF